MPILKVAIGNQALRFCYGTQFLIRLLTVVSINFNAVEFLYLLQWTQCYTIKGKTYIQKGKKLSENHRLAGARRALCVPQALPLSSRAPRAGYPVPRPGSCWRSPGRRPHSLSGLMPLVLHPTERRFCKTGISYAVLRVCISVLLFLYKKQCMRVLELEMKR